jgi:hypothetical protein
MSCEVTSVGTGAEPALNSWVLARPDKGAEPFRAARFPRPSGPPKPLTCPQILIPCALSACNPVCGGSDGYPRSNPRPLRVSTLWCPASVQSWADCRVSLAALTATSSLDSPTNPLDTSEQLDETTGTRAGASSRNRGGERYEPVLPTSCGCCTGGNGTRRGAGRREREFKQSGG